MQIADLERNLSSLSSAELVRPHVLFAGDMGNKQGYGIGVRPRSHKAEKKA